MRWNIRHIIFCAVSVLAGCAQTPRGPDDLSNRPITSEEADGILKSVGDRRVARFVGIDLASIEWSQVPMPLPVRSVELDHCQLSKSFVRWLEAHPSIEGIWVKGPLDVSLLLESRDLQRRLTGIGMTHRMIDKQTVRQLLLFTKLRELDLMDTDLNDADALNLAAHLHLAQFFIGDTRVTESGVIEIIKVRPGMGIYPDQ